MCKAWRSSVILKREALEDLKCESIYVIKCNIKATCQCEKIVQWVRGLDAMREVCNVKN